ncbi:MAG: hypothetical protein Q4G47_05425 [Lachnospiraceae bacterium]|nr:hypothetical protein [Lachnospiraceae bacterium]
MDNIEHYFVKNYDRIRVKYHSGKNEDNSKKYAAVRCDSISNTDENIITGHTACPDIKLLGDMLYSYYHVGDVRNKISHADDVAMGGEKKLMPSESDVAPSFKWLTESIEYFISSYEKALSSIEGKTPAVIKIKPSEVRAYADRLKKEEHEEK